jgi:hypothetical protein
MNSHTQQVSAYRCGIYYVGITSLNGVFLEVFKGFPNNEVTPFAQQKLPIVALHSYPKVKPLCWLVYFSPESLAVWQRDYYTN